MARVMVRAILAAVLLTAVDSWKISSDTEDPVSPSGTQEEYDHVVAEVEGDIATLSGTQKVSASDDNFAAVVANDAVAEYEEELANETFTKKLELAANDAVAKYENEFASETFAKNSYTTQLKKGATKKHDEDANRNRKQEGEAKKMQEAEKKQEEQDRKKQEEDEGKKTREETTIKDEGKHGDSDRAFRQSRTQSATSDDAEKYVNTDSRPAGKEEYDDVKAEVERELADEAFAKNSYTTQLKKGATKKQKKHGEDADRNRKQEGEAKKMQEAENKQEEQDRKKQEEDARKKTQKETTIEDEGKHGDSNRANRQSSTPSETRDGTEKDVNTDSEPAGKEEYDDVVTEVERELADEAFAKNSYTTQLQKGATKTQKKYDEDADRNRKQEGEAKKKQEAEKEQKDQDGKKQEEDEVVEVVVEEEEARKKKQEETTNKNEGRHDDPNRTNRQSRTQSETRDNAKKAEYSIFWMEGQIVDHIRSAFEAQAMAFEHGLSWLVQMLAKARAMVHAQHEIKEDAKKDVKTGPQPAWLEVISLKVDERKGGVHNDEHKEMKTADAKNAAHNPDNNQGKDEITEREVKSVTGNRKASADRERDVQSGTAEEQRSQEEKDQAERMSWAKDCVFGLLLVYGALFMVFRPSRVERPRYSGSAGVLGSGFYGAW